MTNPVIIKTIYIDASPEVVWQYLVDKKKLGEWFHPAKSDSDQLEAGNDYSLIGKEGGDICWGKVITSKEPTHLSYTFTHDHLKGVGTLVDWELTAADDGTQLKLTHTGFEKVTDNMFGMLNSHDKGWDEHLTRLRELS